MGETNLFDLSGEWRLSGGGYGIGRASARRSPSLGLMWPSRTSKKNWPADSGRIARFGHRTLAIKADVSVTADVEGMVNETVLKWAPSTSCLITPVSS